MTYLGFSLARFSSIASRHVSTYARYEIQNLYGCSITETLKICVPRSLFIRPFSRERRWNTQVLSKRNFEAFSLIVSWLLLAITLYCTYVRARSSHPRDRRKEIEDNTWTLSVISKSVGCTCLPPIVLINAREKSFCSFLTTHKTKPARTFIHFLLL